MSVDVELVAVVGRYVHDVSFRFRRQIQRLAEDIDAIGVQRFSGDGDPPRVPSSFGPAGGDVALAVAFEVDLGAGCRGRQQSERKQKQFFHRFGFIGFSGSFSSAHASSASSSGPRTVLGRLPATRRYESTTHSRISFSGRSPSMRTVFQWRLFMCQPGVTSAYRSRSAIT